MSVGAWSTAALAGVLTVTTAKAQPPGDRRHGVAGNVHPRGNRRQFSAIVKMAAASTGCSISAARRRWTSRTSSG